MKYCNWAEINKLAVASVGKYAVYISNGLDYAEDDEIWNFVVNEVKRLFPKDYDVFAFNLIHGGLFFFEDYKTACLFHKIFEQELTDSSAIYACLYNGKGECLTENT